MGALGSQLFPPPPFFLGGGGGGIPKTLQRSGEGLPCTGTRKCFRSIGFDTKYNTNKEPQKGLSPEGKQYNIVIENSSFTIRNEIPLVRTMTFSVDMISSANIVFEIKDIYLNS